MLGSPADFQARCCSRFGDGFSRLRQHPAQRRAAMLSASLGTTSISITLLSVPIQRVERPLSQTFLCTLGTATWQSLAICCPLCGGAEGRPGQTASSFCRLPPGSRQPAIVCSVRLRGHTTSLCGLPPGSRLHKQQLLSSRRRGGVVGAGQIVTVWAASQQPAFAVSKARGPC
jgi:hypothetical protein